ncbi:hypothetical protein IQ272_30200 [Chroococcidiopsidales cyanobacterium LEGE 13417]|uniref:hypothetical protein n=1 Tax=Chroococcidiopsis sp. CCALA 051 TaxID=869949 RepID=UPI0011B249A8|nr:hypothetical protein [Chroococcidiopsis sp. CCALA 051]MBE9020329.1 hypothetical protein [Chroococcidiopsidales cyanobacterium LEGE 13417]
MKPTKHTLVALCGRSWVTEFAQKHYRCFGALVQGVTACLPSALKECARVQLQGKAAARAVA